MHFFRPCDSQFLMIKFFFSDPAFLYDITYPPIGYSYSPIIYCSPVNPSLAGSVIPSSTNSDIPVNVVLSNFVAAPSQILACQYIPVDYVLIPDSSTSLPSMSRSSPTPLLPLNTTQNIPSSTSYKLRGSKLVSDSHHPSVSVSNHHMQTRSKTKSLQALLTYAVNIDVLIESVPKSIHQVLLSSHWKAAMDEKLYALYANHT